MRAAFYAHSLASRPPEDWEPLEDHLRLVANLAGRFAASFGASDWGNVAGLWHDLGKYSGEFQDYLFHENGVEAHLEQYAGREASGGVQVGDATVVFWTEAPTEAESFFGFVFEATGTEDEEAKSRLGTVLQRVASGEYPVELGNSQTPFYILGLSANAARVSIRFWYQSTLAEVIARVGAHYRDLELARSPRDPQFPEPWRLLRETARESKDIAPTLSGALLRAILNETLYPEAMFSAVIRRIRADRQVNYVRTSVLKACINRKVRLQNGSQSQETPVSLDPNRAESAYHMGRLFAELEKTQEDALPTLNDTIKDRYFSAASSTPAAVFPRLIRLSQHHLGKLDRGNKIYHERRIQEICEKVDSFAPHLGLKDQGLFAIGYYHQRHDIFTKKSSTTAPSDEE